MRTGAWALLLAAHGCGRIYYDPTERGGTDASAVDAQVSDVGVLDDARPEDATGPDGARDDATVPEDASGPDAATAGCVDLWLEGRWALEVPAPIAEVNTASTEGDPTLSADGLTVFFRSNRPGGLGSEDIWYASRAEGSAPFGTPVNATDLNSASRETRVSLSADGLAVALSTDRPGPDALRMNIWVGLRSRADVPFEELTYSQTAPINTDDQEYDVLLSGDGLRAYWACCSMTFGAQRIAYADRASRTEPFGSRMLLEDVNGTMDEGAADASFTADARVVFFASERPGAKMWFATRPDAASAFGEPVPLPSLDGPDRDQDPFVRGDGCELLFASDRPGGAGDMDLWSTRVVPR